MIALLAASACLMGSGQYTAPLTVCTPGAYVHLSTAAVCATKERPSLPAVERRKKDALENYVRWRVCLRRPYPMSVRYAHRIFATNWMVWYFHYGLDHR
jgi:hypothetical protein